MIAKGNLHGDGAMLARYMMTGEKGEIAELVETRGLDGFGGDPVTAFTTLQQIAESQTNSTKPFFHTQTRNAPGEQLTSEQWLQVADREEKRLGFSGQPRIVSFHIDPATNEKHLHVAWFRIDLETMRAIDPGMFKNHLKELSRKLEKEFSLREVSNERAADDKTRAPDRKEFEEARRLKTDLKAIRNTILDCWQQSDNGKALKAALGAHGLMLANGDRRDCVVVVDQAGGQHALNKKLTGLTLAETRNRLGDLDRAQLPSVEAAKVQQHVREAAREARQSERIGIDHAAANAAQEVRQQPAAEIIKTAEPPSPIWERDKDSAERDKKIAEAAIAAATAKDKEARAGSKSRQQPAPVKKVDQDQAAAKSRYAPLKTPEPVLEVKPEVNRAAPTEAMRAAAQAAWAAEREKARPATSIENRIAECARAATLSGAIIRHDSKGKPLTAVAALADRLRPEDERTSTGKWVYGAQAFTAQLESAGIALVRVTETDVKALAVLRHDEELSRLAAKTNGEARQPQQFAELLAGELAAVMRNGDVHRINADKIGSAARLLAADLPGVVEVRAAFEIEREKTSEIWTAKRAEIAAEKAAFAETRTIWEHTSEPKEISDKAASRGLAWLARGVESVLSGIFGFFVPGPKMTPAQLRDQARADGNLETQHARAFAAAEHEKATNQDELIFQQNKQQQQADQSFAALYGTPPTAQERNTGRGRDDDYERGRER